jgi:hypothetical protein
MKTIKLDATSWKSVSDFYDALLPAIGAPDWHGRNINALIDSMVVGGINNLHPPYAVTIVNAIGLPEAVSSEVVFAANAIQEGRRDWLARTGEDVVVSLELA